MLLLSIKSRFVEKILSGAKTIELRRRQPRGATPGDWLAIYETMPTGAIVGVARVAALHSDAPERLWTRFGDASGIRSAEYSRYFEGAKNAVGIELFAPVRLAKCLTLPVLRQKWLGFNPPQGFLYLTDKQSKLVLSNLSESVAA